MMNMDNQGIEGGPSLGFKNSGYRFRIQGIRSQAIHGLRGDSHQRSRSQRFRRTNIQLAVV